MATRRSSDRLRRERAKADLNIPQPNRTSLNSSDERLTPHRAGVRNKFHVLDSETLDIEMLDFYGQMRKVLNPGTLWVLLKNENASLVRSSRSRESEAARRVS